MGAAPKWKVYNAEGDYAPAVKDPFLGAALVALIGDGATIRLGHGKGGIRWTEGKEIIPAAESYDVVAGVCYERQRGKP